MKKLHKIGISSKIALIIFGLSLAPQHALGTRVDGEENHDNDDDSNQITKQAVVFGLTLGALYMVFGPGSSGNDAIKNDDNYFHVLADEGVITCRPNRTLTDGAYSCRPNTTASEVLSKFYERDDIESILRKYNQDLREHFKCNFTTENKEKVCNINAKQGRKHKNNYDFPKWSTKRCNRTFNSGR